MTLPANHPAAQAATNKKLVLFTPGPVKTPPLVAEYLANPPCNYHRQEAFSEMFAANEADTKTLLGIANPDAYFATMITSTGTGANEAVLLALAGLGKGLILRNGYFGNRAVEQVSQTGIDHVVLDAPEDRPIDPAEVSAAIDNHADLKWVFFVSHETRTGLANPLEEIGKLCKERGLMVGTDVVSSSYAYPIDLEAAQIDLAVSSSAKAIMAAPGLGMIFVRRDSVPVLEKSQRSLGYYLDVVAEYKKQSTEYQTRFAQPVVLHAALRAACEHLKGIGIANHMARIRRQLTDVADHLASLGVDGILNPEYRSWIAVNFRLPSSLPYADFSQAMAERGYFLLYGIPGDSTHFQISTIGDLSDDDVSGLKGALTDVLRR